MVVSLVLQERRFENDEVDPETVSIKFSFEGSDDQLDMNSIYILSDPVLNRIAQIKGNLTDSVKSTNLFSKYLIISYI
jgi:hypothetical protein